MWSSTNCSVKAECSMHSQTKRDLQISRDSTVINHSCGVQRVHTWSSSRVTKSNLSAAQPCSPSPPSTSPRSRPLSSHHVNDTSWCTCPKTINHMQFGTLLLMRKSESLNRRSAKTQRLSNGVMMTSMLPEWEAELFPFMTLIL